MQVVSWRDDMTENIKYGGYGISNVYNLTLANDQVSSHNIWIETGPVNHINMIVAGWQVLQFRGKYRECIEMKDIISFALTRFLHNYMAILVLGCLHIGRLV